MKKFLLLICLLLSACAASKTQTEVSVPQPALSPMEIAALPFGDHGRVALALLQVASIAAEEGGSKTRFLHYLNQPAGVVIVSKALQSSFKEEEAAQIAGFLESPLGQEGVHLFGGWLLTGQFLKDPVPPQLDSLWSTFRTTSSGVKLFSEASSLYRNIAVTAFKEGGKTVAKAITADIGKDAAKEILGSLLKTGVVFLK